MSLIPKSWKIESVLGLCEEIIDCINKTAPVVEYETPYLMIRTTNVKEGRVNLKGARYVNEPTFIKWTRRLKPRRNDIVLTREAPLGDVGLVRTDANIFLGQRTMVYRANNIELSQRFLYYSLLGPTLQAQIKMFGSGSTVEHMRVPDSKKLEIPYPPLPIQRKIAAILSAYDDLIENNNRRIAILEKMAEELYREWFVRLRFPGHEKVKIVKGVPEGWEVKKLPKVASITYGKPFDGSRFNAEGFGKPIIRIRNIPSSSTNDYTDEYADEKYIISKGDLLIGMDGEFHINHWYSDDAYLVQRCCRIEAKESRLKGYLAKAVYTPVKYYEAILQGATVGHLGAKHLNSIDILIPPDRIDLTIFNKLLKQKVKYAYECNLLKKTRDRLLSRLMSGKIDVENLDIQFPPSMKEEMANG